MFNTAHFLKCHGIWKMKYAVEWYFPQDSGGFSLFGSSWKLGTWVAKRSGNHDLDVCGNCTCFHRNRYKCTFLGIMFL